MAWQLIYFGKSAQIPGRLCPCGPPMTFYSQSVILCRCHLTKVTKIKLLKLFILNILTVLIKLTIVDANSPGCFIQRALLSLCGFTGVRTQWLSFTVFTVQRILQFCSGIKLLIKIYQLHLANLMHFTRAGEKQGWCGKVGLDHIFADLK